MGFVLTSKETKYDISDLGYLDGTRDTNLEGVLRLTVQTLAVPVALAGFADDTTGRFVQKGCRGGVSLPDLPQSDALAMRICEESRVIGFTDATRADDRTFRDVECLNCRGFIGAPVYGPAGENAGVLIAADHVERDWTVAEETAMRDLAAIVTQQILLKAALLTLKLVVREGQRTSIHDLPH